MIQKIKLIFFLILISSSLFLKAQTISGKVVDRETNEPLAGASIRIFNTLKGVVADAKGNYSITILSDKNSKITAAFIGYQSISQNVLLKKGENITLDFLLKSQSVEQDEIIVTGTRTSTARANIPLTTSVINQMDIESSSEINLMPLLSSSVPGLFVTERGISGFGVADGAAGKVSIRGIGSGEQSQLLVMIDGQPQVMGIFGHAFPDMYQTSNYEKVEVIRGPGSVLYGSNAMGGVINLITKKQQTDGFSARISAQAGSFNTLRGTISSGYKKGGFSVFGAFNHDQTDGDRANSSFKGDNGYLGVNLKLSEHFNLYWTGNYSSFHAVDPGSIYANPDIYSDKKAWADIKRGNTMITFNNSFDKVNGNLKVFYNQGDHSIYTNWVSTDRNYGISLFEGLTLFKNNLIGVGVDWNQYGGIGSPVMSMTIVEGAVKMVPSVYNNRWIDVSEKAVYSFIQQEIGNSVTVNGGIRFTYHSLYGGNWIPQLGVTWKASDNDKFKILASKGFRSPNVKELYFFPPSNPDLKPESLWNYEVGYNKYVLNRKLEAGLTLFYLMGRNLIQAISNPAGGIPPMINENTGPFTHYGAEIEASYRIVPNIKINTSYSFLHTDIPRIASPKHQLYLGGSYSTGKFDFNLSAHGISGLYTLTDNKSTMDIVEEDIQNYLIVNAKINYRILTSLNLFISADNLLNSEYSINYGYPMPGVTILGGISFKIN